MPLCKKKRTINTLEKESEVISILDNDESAILLDKTKQRGPFHRQPLDREAEIINIIDDDDDDESFTVQYSTTATINDSGDKSKPNAILHNVETVDNYRETVLTNNCAETTSIKSTDSSSDDEKSQTEVVKPTKRVTRRGMNLVDFHSANLKCEVECPKSAIYSTKILEFKERKENFNECLNLPELSDNDELVADIQQNNNLYDENNSLEKDPKNEVASFKRKTSPSPPPQSTQTVNKMTRKTKKLLGNLERTKLLYDASKHLYAAIDSPEKQLTDTQIVRNVMAKFRWQDSVFRIPMKSNEKFMSVLPEVLKKCLIQPTEILLAIDEETIQIEDSPDSIGLTSANIIDCYLLNSSTANSLTLLIQASDCKTKISIPINKLSPFSELMNEYAKQRNLPVSKMKFKFDGDVLEPTDTPADLDMDDENCIDVIVSS